MAVQDHPVSGKTVGIQGFVGASVEGQGEAFIGAAGFQEFGDGLDDGRIAFLFKDWKPRLNSIPT